MTIVQLLIVFALLYCVQLYLSKNVMIKIVTATYLFFVASAIYFALETYKGWPTIQEAREGIITSIIIDEPNEDSNGAIYIWVRNSNDSLKWYQWLGYKPTKEPRAFSIPYTKNSAKKFREAKKSIEEGKVVLIESNDKQTSDLEEDSKEGKEPDGKSGNIGDSIEDYKVPHLKIVGPEHLLKKEGSYD
jgi:hypothetical protein